jgi:hypothetical protein
MVFTLVSEWKSKYATHATSLRFLGSFFMAGNVHGPNVGQNPTEVAVTFANICID